MAPQSRALTVLITRPEGQAHRFAAQLHERFGAAVVSIVTPLLAPAFLEASLPGGRFGAVVFTSETGVLAAQRVGAAGRDLPKRAFCVGDHTAQAASLAGFEAISADGDAGDLLDLLRRHPDDAPFLHLRGRDARGSIVEQLQQSGIAAAETVAYEQRPQFLTPQAVAALGAPGPVCVPLFSPRTAQIFAKALGGLNIRADLHLVLMSDAVAQQTKGIVRADRRIAARPTAACMLDALADLIFNA